MHHGPLQRRGNGLLPQHADHPQGLTPDIPWRNKKWIGLRSKRGEELSLSMCWLSGQAETPHELHFISGLPLGYP